MMVVALMTTVEEMVETCSKMVEGSILEVGVEILKMCLEGNGMAKNYLLVHEVVVGVEPGGGHFQDENLDLG